MHLTVFLSSWGKAPIIGAVVDNKSHLGLVSRIEEWVRNSVSWAENGLPQIVPVKKDFWDQWNAIYNIKMLL